MDKLVVLEFDNRDAMPKKTRIVCYAKNVKDICLWYGAFYAEDRYTVKVDNVLLKQKLNGEVVYDPE